MTVLVVGAAVWDVIGHAAVKVAPGADVPGRITRRPGGVAANIARALAAQGIAVRLGSAMGEDGAGDDLVAALAASGIEMGGILRRPGATGSYVAVEDTSGLVAAVADMAVLETAGPAVLDGIEAASTVVLDGNLSRPVVAEALHRARVPVWLVPASPAKARDLLHPGLALAVNRHEAEVICAASFDDAAQAAAALVEHGARRAVVTDGPRLAADTGEGGAATAQPPAVTVVNVTGAGDTAFAALLAAEARGMDRTAALQAAMDAAAAHLAGGQA